MGAFKGKIHWFDSRKKYGYVTDGYGNEYFYHQNGIKRGRQIIIQGFEADDEVEFDLVDGEKGKMATNLELIGDIKPKYDHKKSYRKDHPVKKTGDTTFSKALKDAGYSVGENESEASETSDIHPETTQPEE